MGKRPITTTEEYLTSAPLPEQTETYTVIAHKTAIDTTRETLNNMGFSIERELYRCNQGAQVASGIYHLKYGDDPDVGLMFAWANSYDKSMKFQCSVGGYVHESLASIIGGNMGAWGRKHTGNADNEAVDTISNQLLNAEEYFKELLLQKEAMKNIALDNNKRAEILGKIYLEKDLVTTEQLAVIKSELYNPSFTVSGINNSVWKTYHAIIFALQKSHPKTWITQQRLVHKLFEEEFINTNKANSNSVENSFITEEVNETDPMQLNINYIEAGFTPDFASKPISDIAPTEVEVSIEMSREVLVEEDAWPCMKCGEMQGPQSIFNDGQLCTACYNSED